MPFFLLHSLFLKKKNFSPHNTFLDELVPSLFPPLSSFPRYYKIRNKNLRCWNFFILLPSSFAAISGLQKRKGEKVFFSGEGGGGGNQKKENFIRPFTIWWLVMKGSNRVFTAAGEETLSCTQPDKSRFCCTKFVSPILTLNQVQHLTYLSA